MPSLQNRPRWWRNPRPDAGLNFRSCGLFLTTRASPSLQLQLRTRRVQLTEVLDGRSPVPTWLATTAPTRRQARPASGVTRSQEFASTSSPPPEATVIPRAETARGPGGRSSQGEAGPKPELAKPKAGASTEPRQLPERNRANNLKVCPAAVCQQLPPRL